MLTFCPILIIFAVLAALFIYLRYCKAKSFNQEKRELFTIPKKINCASSNNTVAQNYNFNTKLCNLDIPYGPNNFCNTAQTM